MREDEVESYLVRIVTGAGGRCEKFIPERRSGWPDRIVLMPVGQLVWVELKKPKGGRLSPLQRHAHRVLRNLGQRVEVVWSKAEADALVRELQEGAAAAAHTRA